MTASEFERGLACEEFASLLMCIHRPSLRLVPEVCLGSLLFCWVSRPQYAERFHLYVQMSRYKACRRLEHPFLFRDNSGRTSSKYGYVVH